VHVHGAVTRGGTCLGCRGAAMPTDRPTCVHCDNPVTAPGTMCDPCFLGRDER
jgi:hypothetical protein